MQTSFCRIYGLLLGVLAGNIVCIGHPSLAADPPATRQLHFNYWDCSRAQKHVTSMLAPKDEDTEAATYWQKRGVQLLHWQAGNAVVKDWKTPEKYAEEWQKIVPPQSGIMIDEFGGGNEPDQIMGRALVMTRKQSPRLFLAPYCMAVGGSDMVEGFRAADLILVECYVNDWRSYRVFDDRFGSTCKHGLSKKSLVVLGVGGEWASTEKEIRQQFAYLREKYPEMPGIAFFPRVPDRLTAAVDRAIEDYFLKPTHPPRYQSPLELPMPTDKAQVEAAKYRERFAKGQIVKPLASLQKLDVACSKPKKPDEKGGPENATIVLPTSEGKTVSLSFDVELDRVYFYGRVGVKLVGENCSLGFEWSHHEPDTDVQANVPRAYFMWTGGDKDSIRETIPPAMGPGKKFRFFAAYNADSKTVRGMLLREDGGLMWDTGDIPTGASFRCDKLKLEVTSFEGSDIRLQPETGRLFLRSVSGGPRPSPYVIESWISNLEVRVP